ncbi:MAG TPA: amino acid permease [Saprospiraceae bacterium]|nr:amino acid permease [Saprospiraceae bacterium]HMV23229.1 amino acid permease [Saprospiraceae bacterium]HMX82951.1 amino acid permease [Saprospiraceae bacterium]HMX85344.1 amino acid permease [Saprospiraceae bacterium]HMZ74071.1 amino acid permease [Saprospiraceae bacterium]
MSWEALFRRKSITQVVQESANREGGHQLHRILGVRDLTAFGIAAIIGAGIFSTIGRASFAGGPAVSLLFVGVAIACVFTALCYAQFASMVPVSGSAYTYAYVAFGELFAWIIGWALVLEYAVSNMVVAISWSEYFTSMLTGFGINMPGWLTIDPGTARHAYQSLELANQNGTVGEMSEQALRTAQIYAEAPDFGSFKVIFDLPAGLITVLVTWLVFRGIRESRNTSNILVVLKLAVIILVIIAGAFFIKPENWSPFAPNGVSGVLSGVAAVFFAFIGFDSISTTAEECKNPQRDLPRAMIYCLVICTVLYIAITLVLTGMVNYTELRVDDPLAYVFSKINMDFMAGIISVSAVIAITSALLAFQLGQPRIWMTMSRDGLLWKKFSAIHPKYKTPWFSTLVAGLIVAIPSLFMDMQFFVDLTSVGTFFAFILVCGGVLYLDEHGHSKEAKFKVPYINGKYIIGVMMIISLIVFRNDLWIHIQEKPLLIAFWLTWLFLSVFGFRNNYSLLPVLGILTNLYLMTELGVTNWFMFLLWLVIGLIIYYFYGRKHSKLRAAHS